MTITGIRMELNINAGMHTLVQALPTPVCAKISWQQRPYLNADPLYRAFLTQLNVYRPQLDTYEFGSILRSDPCVVTRAPRKSLLTNCSHVVSFVVRMRCEVYYRVH